MTNQELLTFPELAPWSVDGKHITLSSEACTRAFTAQGSGGGGAPLGSQIRVFLPRRQRPVEASDLKYMLHPEG